MGRGLYDPQYTLDPEEEKDKRSRQHAARCTPDLLLEFINKLGRMPTLHECKQEFGGILGPMLDGWTLRDQGRLPGVSQPLNQSEILDF